MRARRIEEAKKSLRVLEAVGLPWASALGAMLAASIAKASGDDGAVAVTPPDGALNVEGIEDQQRLLHGPGVKVGGERLERRRASVPGAPGDDDGAPGEGLDVDRIDVVPPPAMEEHQGGTVSLPTVRNRD